jgi:hypothetical protein
MYNCINQFCRQQAQEIQNHETAHIQNSGQNKDWHRKYKRLKVGGSQVHDCSSD